MKPDQQRLQSLLCETITMLCRNGLSYKSEIKVQGLVAVTVDDSDVIIVHLNERLEDAIGGFVIPVDHNSHAEAQQNSSSKTQKQNPETSQNSVDGDDAVRQFEISTSRMDATISSGAPADAEADEDSSCRILKVEPTADDDDDADQYNAGNVDFATEEENNKNANNDDEVDGQTFKVVAASRGQKDPDPAGYGFLHASNSSTLEVSGKDLESDANAAVALLSTSVRSYVHDQVQIKKGNLQRAGGQAFTNVLPDVGSLGLGTAVTDNNGHARIPLPKFMRGFLPIVPGYSGRQQMMTKTERQFLFQRQASRLPRRPRESTEKHFICPFCGLSYYYKKHLKFHLRQKHSF